MKLFIYFIASLIFILTFSYYLRNSAFVYVKIINTEQFEHEVYQNMNKNNIAYYTAIIISILMIENAIRKNSGKNSLK
jgi:hypothetical protein